MPQYEILVSKSILNLNKGINADFRGLFKALAKGIVDAGTGNLGLVGKDVIDGLATLTNNQDVEHQSWLLIYRALARAIRNLVEDNQISFHQDYKNYDSINKSIKEDLKFPSEEKEITIGKNFFTHPETLLDVIDIKTTLHQWVQYYGLTRSQADNISDRLSSYFIFALNDEWHKRSQDYQEIKAYFDTPFSDAAQRENSLFYYKKWLQQDTDKPVFDETFSLRQIYIPLRAYYQKKVSNRSNYEPEAEKYEKTVVELEEHLLAWINRNDKNDGLKIISGDPGSGKSSCVKILAAKLAETSNIPLFLIPLHRFKVKDDLIEAFDNYISEQQFFSENFSFKDYAHQKVLIIFDGLDELMMQGKMGEKVARSFIDEVQRKIKELNYETMRLQVIISGRPASISINEDNLRNKEQILYLLPYFVLENNRNKYNDPQDLLQEDRRNNWWRRYGELKGLDYTELPDELSLDNLTEITKQPLLNYLISLSYERSKNPDIPKSEKIEFSNDTSLNAIYHDLLSSVYNRRWDSSGRHLILQDVRKSDFYRILEEIALVAWYGNGRTTTVGELETHCQQNGLERVLNDFKKGAEFGTTNLILTFFFRHSGHGRDRDQTFEFTHKSFGEFLTVKRIVRALKKIDKELQRKQDDFNDGWDQKQALIYWVEVSGKSAIDEYLLAFIRNEIALEGLEKAKRWQSILCNLIQFMLCQGTPMEAINPRCNYSEELRQARNAEEGLIIFLNACARLTEKVSQIDWSSKELSFRRWLLRLQNPESCQEFAIVNLCLEYLNLSSTNLSGVDLSRAHLIGAHLIGANLSRADLSGADLSGVDLSRANLISANLSGAHLSGSYLSGAHLIDTNLSGANLSGAHLIGTNLSGAHLSSANLSGSYLSSADLSGAHLSGANLSGANLSGAHLRSANLSGANLSGANMTSIVWDSKTEWSDSRGLEFALNVPEELKAQLLR